ncbi:MAG: glycosyltransferase [Acidimicrobiales bacterium]
MRSAVLSSSRWAGFLGNVQALALALFDRGHDVLYVDPPVSPLSLLRQPQRIRDLTGRALERPHPRLRIWRPRVLPGQNSAFGQRMNARLLDRGISRHVGSPDLVLVSALEARGVMRRLGGTRVYICIDSFEDLPGLDSTVIRAREQDLMAAVDVVAACSLPLQAQLAERGIRAIYLPHGCDPRFLVPEEGLPVPSELAGLPRPIVGYVGGLNFRIEPGLLEAARRASEGGTLVLIGGSSGAAPAPGPRVRELLARPGVVATGHRDGASLPAYLAALDVGLVPYANVPFNRKSYPLKVPQYLAAGLPVVSTPNGATDDLPGHVLVATDPASFEVSVRSAIDSDSAERRASRRRVAAARPWSVVIEEILAACRDLGSASL